MPWAVAAGVVSGGAAIYSGNKAEDAARDASGQTQQTAAAEAARLETATTRASNRLQPYSDQEALGRNQMMRQLGLVGGGQSYRPGDGGTPQGGAVMGGGGGAGLVPLGAPVESDEQKFGVGQNADFNKFLEDVLADQIAISARAGYSDNNNKAATEGARRTEVFLRQMQAEGNLPADFEVPQMQDLQSKAVEMKSSGLDVLNYGLNESGQGQSPIGPESYQAVLARYKSHGGSEKLLPSPAAAAAQEVAPGGVQMGGPGGQPAGAPQMMGGGPANGVQNIDSIQQRAGVSAPGQEFQENYYEDLEAPTPQFGMDYQNNPAYQKMQDETAKNVNQYAANAGSLYSGRRGEALREASASTQMGFYQDLADREQRAHEGSLARRGDAVQGLQGREDQYYTNYMNLLGNLSSPTTATNIANLETGNAANIAQSNTAATASQNRSNLAGTQAQGAAFADAAGALSGGISTAIKR